MALGTVGCALPQRPPQPAPDVLGPRDRLQVVGVHAAPIPAKVVKLEAVGHGPDVVLVCPSVPDDGLASFQPEPSVTTWQDVAGPVPATRSLVNLVFPVKPLNGRRSLAQLDNYQFSVWDDSSFKSDPFALIDVVTCSTGTIWRGRK